MLGGTALWKRGRSRSRTYAGRSRWRSSTRLCTRAGIGRGRVVYASIRFLHGRNGHHRAGHSACQTKMLRNFASPPGVDLAEPCHGDRQW